MSPRNAGAASLLTLALFAGLAAAVNFGVAAVAKRAPAPSMATIVVPADPVSPLLDLVRAVAADPTRIGEVRGAKGLFVKNVAGIAAVAKDDVDPSQPEAIAALGIAGTDEAREALRGIVEDGSPADAKLATDALGATGFSFVAP